MSNHYLAFGSATIDYRLERKERKTLRLTVTPELNVIVTAPLDASMEKIEAKVRKRAPWILRQREYFLRFYPLQPPRRYVGGETHRYLGRAYRLKVVPGQPESVKLKGAFLEVMTDDISGVKLLVLEWYGHRAQAQFPRIAQPLIDRFAKYGVAPKSLIIRDMPRRWGSCTPKGNILLNPELICAPRGCIEYVILHELCHLIHPDHGQQFITLQTKEMPDWRVWKERLEKG